MPMRLVLIASVMAGVTLGPGAAGAIAADDLVYRCGANLWKVRPDGSGRQQLTRDGRPSGPAYTGRRSASPCAAAVDGIASARC